MSESIATFLTMFKLPISAVCGATRLSAGYIRTFDDELKPERGPGGRRLYDLRVVEEFIAARAAKAGAR
jgi:hypothetical protein